MNMINQLARLSAAFSVSFLAWLLFFFGLAQPFGLSIGLAAGVGVILLGGMQWYAHHLFLQKHQLKWKEYAYIRKNLHEAKEKIGRLQKSYVHVRSLTGLKRLFTVNRLAKRIYTIVKKEPKRFYQAERFFFYHLDSVVELTEKHAFLSAQIIKDAQLQQSLHNTRLMIDQLIKSIEKDLRHLLSKDMDHLEFELDVAKHSLQIQGKPLNERSSGKWMSSIKASADQTHRRRA